MYRELPLIGVTIVNVYIVIVTTDIIEIPVNGYGLVTINNYSTKASAK